MKDNVKEMLKRYDNLVALILEQKVDEYSDMLDQVPPDEDTATYEEYIRKAARSRPRRQPPSSRMSPTRLWAASR